MIISDKSELVKLIRQDWRNMDESARQDSFIYGYKKEEMAARVRQLIGEPGLTTLRAIMDYDKDKKDDKDNEDHKSIIRKYGIYPLVRAAREVYISHDRSEEYSEMYAKIFWKMYAKVRDLKKEIINTDPPSEGEADSFEASLLKGLVTDYFRNKGYKTQKVRTMDDDAFTEKDPKDNTASKDEYDVVEVMPENRGDPFYTDEIKMLNAFLQYLDGKGEEKSLQDTEKGKEHFVPEVLDDAAFAWFSGQYSELVEKKRDRVFMPLLFDSTCGAGLFIIGAKIFVKDDGSVMPHSDMPCYACNVHFESYAGSVSIDDDEVLIDFTMGIDRYDNMKDAVDGFKSGKAGWIETIIDSMDTDEKVIAAYKQGREGNLGKKKKREEEIAYNKKVNEEKAHRSG